MNRLDKAIAVISPRWAYNRQAWRSGLSLFDAADRGRLNQGWNPAAPDGFRKRAEREMTRARAQDLERNSDIAAGILQAFERNVTGTGITLQAKISEDIAGNKNGELNQKIEDLWKEFCKAENVDITGTQSLEEITDMIVRRYIVDGGIFIIKVRVKDPRFPFKLQVRSVDELHTPIAAFEGKRIVDGVELDEYNRPIAYHFKKMTEGYSFNPSESTRILAEDAIFLFKKTHPSQIREMSQLVTALPRVKDANQFVEAVSIKERVLACMSVFIKSNLPQQNSGGIGRGVRNQIEPEEIDYSGVSLSPGMIGKLNPGDEVQTVIPNGQASNTREFITTLVRMVAAGIGLSYEAVSRDLSQVNYSSARQGLIEDRKLYKKMQKMIIDRALTPIYLEFLEFANLKNLLSLPGYAKDNKTYTPHVWVPPGSTWIDPLKEAKANEAALLSNQDTLARICAERGDDWRDVVAQRAVETKLIRELIGDPITKGVEKIEKPTDDTNTE